MVVEVTLEKLALVASIAGVTCGLINYLVYLWASSKFVTRKEWHDENNKTAVILANVQTQGVEIKSQLEAGDQRMNEMARDSRDTRDLVQRMTESTSELKGMIMVLGGFSSGGTPGHRRKEDRQWKLDL